MRYIEFMWKNKACKKKNFLVVIEVHISDKSII